MKSSDEKARAGMTKAKSVLGAVVIVFLIIGAASYYVFASSLGWTTATTTEVITWTATYVIPTVTVTSTSTITQTVYATSTSGTSTTTSATSTTSTTASSTLQTALAAIVDNIHGKEYDGSANGSILAANYTIVSGWPAASSNVSASWDNSVPSLKCTVGAADGDMCAWQIPLTTFTGGTFQVTLSASAPLTFYQEIFVGFWDGALKDTTVLVGPQNGVAFGLCPFGGSLNNSRAYNWIGGSATYSNGFTPPPLTTPHTYKIVWSGGQASFYIDGTLLWSGGGTPTSGVYLRLAISNERDPTPNANPTTVTFTNVSVSP